MADKIIFRPEDDEEAVEFYVVEQTTIAGVNYILVTEAEDGDADAYILKDMSKTEEEEAVYDMVTEDSELDAVSGVFESILDEEVDFVRDDD